jgi:hypothetical protein
MLLHIIDGEFVADAAFYGSYEKSEDECIKMMYRPGLGRQESSAMDLQTRL